ncbi:MAG: cytochrome c [Alphaproteobacteria bacterium]
MKSNSARLAAALVVSGSLSFSAAFAAVDPVKSYETRHAHFHAIYGALQSIMDGLKLEAPDTDAIAMKAQTIEGLAHQIPTWFPAGTGPEGGAKTRAKTEIWTDSVGFAAAAKNLETQSAALQTLAKTGDIAAVQAQAKAVGGACGACHTKFRGPEVDHDHDHK